MLFKDVIAQDELKKQLKATIVNRKVSHAQLFSGNEGCGHFAMALAYTQFLLCTNKKEDSCGECSSCLKLHQLSHPDVHFSFPVQLAKANKVESSDDLITPFREMVVPSAYIGFSKWNNIQGNKNKQGIIAVKESEANIKKLSLKSFEGGYKVLIMWLPEQMNKEAANKLLKLIEEPPKETLFIFVSDQPEKIIDTILSRLQRINFSNLPANKIEGALVDKYNIDSQKAASVATLADGSFHRALTLTKQENNVDFYLTEFVNWMRLCYSRNISDTIDWVDHMAASGREKQKEFLLFTLEMFRQSILGHYSKGTLTVLSSDQQQFLNKFSPFINHLNIVGLNEVINQAYYHLERNANPKILLLDVSLKIYALLKKQ